MWGVSWIAGLATSLTGGAVLIWGLISMKEGPVRTPARSWTVAAPVAVSLVLISLGVGWPSPIVRFAFTGIGTLLMLVVLVHIIDDRLRVERQLAERALADASRHLAREVHDVVGHTLAASMLHTAAARLSVRSNPDAAITSLERAEQQGRASIDHIHSVVRLLRDDDAESPAYLAAELPQLVDGLCLAGIDITASVTGELDDLRPATAFAVYRVAQEGLTNAVRHGSGPIRMTVTGVDHTGCVELCVSNDRARDRSPIPTAGTGLTGMRERVHAVGGTLEAGPIDEGRRWLLRARIPA